MSYPYIDTDVIIHLLTGDDQTKQRQAQALFEQVEQGKLIVTAPDTVIAHAVYVLHSKRLYNKSKADVSQLLIPLVCLPSFRIKNHRAVLAALRLYAEFPALDFTDALIIALMQQSGQRVVYSYDIDYDQFRGITRRELQSGPFESIPTSQIDVHLSRQNSQKVMEQTRLSLGELGFQRVRRPPSE